MLKISFGSFAVGALLAFLPAGSNASAQDARSIVGRVVSPESLGNNISYIEHVLGVPARTTDIDPLGYERNTYEVGQCNISVGVKEYKVVSVGTNLIAGQCDVEVSLHVNTSRPTYASETTYGDWARRGGLYHFVSEAFAGCNACGDANPPSMYTIGNGAAGYFDVAVGGWDHYEAASPWFSAIARSNIDTDRLPTSAEGCPLAQFSRVGLSAMSGARVRWIEFGEAGAIQPACNPRTVLKIIRGDYIGLSQ
jgi:hypothetical protein